MSKIADPGKGLPRDEAKAARLKAWKRPHLKKDREAAKAERLKAWEVRYGSAGSAQ